MTEQESKCYGMSTADIDMYFINSTTGQIAGPEMVVMGIMSDCQEMLAGGGTDANEWVRKRMNIAKYILSRMMRMNREQNRTFERV